MAGEQGPVTEIGDERMTFRVSGYTIAEAWRSDSFGWLVCFVGEPFKNGLTRDQAITALTIAELRVAGMSENDPVIVSFLSELS